MKQTIPPIDVKSQHDLTIVQVSTDDVIVMHGWRMIYAKYDCILIWLRCQIFNKIIKQLKSKVTLENLRGTVLKAKIFDIVTGHFHCMFESVCVWFDLCYKMFIACWNFVGIYNSHKAIYLSGFRQKYLQSFMTFFNT